MEPTASSPEPVDRASSLEPSSTRPNPFDDSDVASRKRRRTSGSGESIAQSSDRPNTSFTLDGDDAMSDQRGSANDHPPMPRQTDRPSSPDGHSTEPAPSQVTLNIRKIPPNGKTTSSVQNASRSPEAAAADHVDADGQETAAEENSALGLRQEYNLASSDTGSPPVELVPEAGDEDADLGTPIEGVSILGESRPITDPTKSFPYQDSQEQLSDTVNRLVQYISSPSPLEPPILVDVERWLEVYVEFVKLGDPDHVTYSLTSNRPFWLAYPDIVLAMASRRPPLHKNPTFREIILKFYTEFINLTLYLVKFDIQSIREAQAAVAAGDRRPPSLYSGGFLNQVHLITRREGVSDEDYTSLFDGSMQIPDDSVTLLNHLDANGFDSFDLLDEFSTALIEVLPSFPKLIDYLGFVCQLLVNLLRRASTPSLPINEHAEPTAPQIRLEKGHQLWVRISDCMTTLLEKHATQLTNEGVPLTISALSEILKCCMLGRHQLATESREKHRDSHEQLPDSMVPDAIAQEWRFGMLEKLIRCSQMQLRVTGVTTMCTELVSLWKRLGEDPDNPLLKYVGGYLLQSNLIEYILGPNCHPEIILESANIIGFLVVTKMYQKEHTDRLWQGITSSQDPRIADALARMVGSIANLFDYSSLLDLCAKFDELPITSFTSSIRLLWDQIMRQMVTKSVQDSHSLGFQPYKLCLRLLRGSSIACNSSSQVLHPELQGFAMQKFRELLSHGPDPTGREELYQSCLDDLAEKSDTTLGSLWALNMAIRSTVAHEMHVLAQNYDLSRLVVEEFEHVVENRLATGVQPVISGGANQPRRDVVTNIIRHQPATIDDDLGRKLWDILVGPRSLCRQDRESGWRILNDTANRDSGKNSFIRTCLTHYLPVLPASCFCEGTLDFVKCESLTLVDQHDDFHLDDPTTVRASCLEQLWRIILTGPDPHLAAQAIHILAVEVYMNAELLSAYPPLRIRQVHSSLVNRCFDQMKASASRIKASTDGALIGESEPMVIVATEEQVEEEERTFTRSLQLLKYFLEAHQTKPHLAAPDLRALMSQCPSEIAGDPAQLKYQSFDGIQQTEVKPLNIGRRNTAASLLASIRHETGFQNYRAYYRGRPFIPNEEDVCRSLEDLQVHDGLILVKREEEEENPTRFKYKPGSSSLQIEVLSHFQEMWDYLDLEESLAREIYHFLIRLPADVGIIESFEADFESYKDIFPPGQPFRCLYAIHALFEYKQLAGRSMQTDEMASKSSISLSKSYAEARQRTVSRLVEAILDPEGVSNSAARLDITVTSSLMQALNHWLQDSELLQADFDSAKVGIASPERFIDILSASLDLGDDEPVLILIFQTTAAILRLGLLDAQFWMSVASSEKFREAMFQLTLAEERKQIRSSVVKLIHEFLEAEDRLQQASSPDVTTEPGEGSAYGITRYFSDLTIGLISQAAAVPSRCYEFFTLTYDLMQRSLVRQPKLVNSRALASQASELLLRCQSSEDIDQLEPFDPVIRGLVSLLQLCLHVDDTIVESEISSENLAYELYWRHLFPRTREQFEQPVPKVVLNSESRAKLGDIVFRLVRQDREKFSMILNSINDVVPFFSSDEDDPYLYEIPGSFDRTKAMRATCGYVGLRNLSNTCYLNSLLTQLFMNPSFRRFLMSTQVDDPEGTQELLYYTKKIFGFMQESYRRFVDPVDFVTCIKTYDDTLIDIHSQMDVDEFYNLLFDRWESQLLNAQEKKQLRAFYGGQLVQQVKSKECEHISERLEPFSAIQCDIKGKTTLKDSLQAYVDGEVLEGDNKYKCSTCDRHVDAVKRACIKDLPDSIIFHLKRFDFNLRTLQRSKINDYFSFDAKIDMKPYTVEHLSDPSDNEEDIFELVGVLVHAGTAESGHYYSYIRERPTGPGRPNWVEFNDDNVMPWDSNLMEASTFGGTDHRPPFDNNGVAYDKSYSAYMLFYQRASSLKKQQEEHVQQGLSTPVRVNVDGQQKEHILDENTNLLRRHCLFDPSHAVLVQQFFHRAIELDEDESHSEAEPMDEDQSPKEVLPIEQLRDLAMEVALSHLDQIVSRKKDLPEFVDFMNMLENAVATSAEDAYSFYKYFYLRPPAFRSLLQRNPDQLVRKRISDQFLRVLKKISTDMPQNYASTSASEVDVEAGRAERLSIGASLSTGRHGVPVLGGVMYIFKHLWRYFQVHIRAWDEHFGTILGFAKLGDWETAHLLADDYPLKLCRIIAADPTVDLPSNYARMLHNVLRRLNNRPPSYTEIISTINYLIKQLAPRLGPDTIVESPTDRLSWQQTPFSWTAAEASFFHDHPEGKNYSFFVEKLLGIDQQPKATDEIIVRLVETSEQMDNSVATALKINIRRDGAIYPAYPFLRAAREYLNHTEIVTRPEILANHVAAEARHLDFGDIPALLTFFQTAMNLEREDPDFSHMVHDHCLKLINRWVPSALAHPSPDVRSGTIEMLNNELFHIGPDYEFDDEEDDLVKEDKEEIIVETIQRLAVGCLRHLADVYVSRGLRIGREPAETIIKTAKKCKQYFGIDVGITHRLLEEFTGLQDDISEPLRRLVVDQIDDDGTDWDGSCASSDQMDGIAAEMNMQGMNELNDLDAA